MLERAKSRFNNRSYWYKITSFLIYLIILLLLVLVIVKLDRGLQLNSLRLLALQAAAFGFLLSLIKKLHPITIILSTVVSGFSAVFLAIGNLAEPLIAVLRATFNHLAIYWKSFFTEVAIYPNISILQEKWTILEQAAGALFGRLRIWLVALPEPAYDPVSMNLIWGFVLWIISIWIFWFVVNKKYVLAGIFPPLIIITNVYRNANVSISTLFWILGLGLLLNLLANLANHEDYWKKNRLSISFGIRRKTVQYAFSLSMSLVIVAGIITSPRLDDLIDEIRERRQATSSSSPVSPSQTDAEAFQGESGPSEVLGEAAFGRFPNTHLVGSGPELAETEVMYVHINDPLSQGTGRYYLRSATYDTYTLHGWLTADKGFIQFQPTPVSSVNFTSNESLIFQAVSLLEDYEQGNLMYTVGELAASNVPYFASFHTKFKNDTYTDIFASVTQETEYSAYSIVPHFGEDELRRSSLNYPSWITNKYLQIPDEVPDRVYNLSLRLTATEPTQYDRALAIEQYLRGFEYTLDLEKPPEYHDLVDYFIFELGKGYCDYFATSMVVLSRAAGIPARLVTGYAASTYDLERDQYIVTADQAHSWAELYFAGFGWVTFEPTPGRPGLDRLDQREQSLEELADSMETDPLDQTLGRRLSNLIPNNLFSLVGQILLVAFLAVAASHWIEFLLLRKTQPSRMFARVYHRMRKSAKGLRLIIRETDTPLEFSEVLTAHLAKLGSSGLLSEVLHTAPQAAAMILRNCNLAAFSKQLPDEDDIQRVLAAWRWLRWRFFLARILIQFKPVSRGLRRVWARLR